MLSVEQSITILSKSSMGVNNDLAPFPSQFTVGIYFSIIVFFYVLTQVIFQYLVMDM